MFIVLNKIWKSRYMSILTKLRIFNMLRKTGGKESLHRIKSKVMSPLLVKLWIYVTLSQDKSYSLLNWFSPSRL